MILSTPEMFRVHHRDEYDPNIVVSGYKLERIKSCKLLGVHINEDLKWDDHIKHTVSGCYATLSILRKLKYLAKYELRKQLAETLILSKLDYADLAFYPLPQFLLRRLQRVQFAAAEENRSLIKTPVNVNSCFLDINYGHIMDQHFALFLVPIHIH